MDMGVLLRTILGAILNYKRVPMSSLNATLVKQILTVAHMIIIKMAVRQECEPCRVL